MPTRTSKPPTPHFLRPEPGETRLAAFLREEGLSLGDVAILSDGRLARETVYRYAKRMADDVRLGEMTVFADSLRPRIARRLGKASVSLEEAFLFLVDLADELDRANQRKRKRLSG